LVKSSVLDYGWSLKTELVLVFKVGLWLGSGKGGRRRFSRGQMSREGQMSGVKCPKHSKTTMNGVGRVLSAKPQNHRRLMQRLRDV